MLFIGGVIIFQSSVYKYNINNSAAADLYEGV